MSADPVPDSWLAEAIQRQPKGSPMDRALSELRQRRKVDPKPVTTCPICKGDRATLHTHAKHPEGDKALCGRKQVHTHWTAPGEKPTCFACWRKEMSR